MTILTKSSSNETKTILDTFGADTSISSNSEYVKPRYISFEYVKPLSGPLGEYFEVVEIAKTDTNNHTCITERELASYAYNHDPNRVELTECDIEKNIHLGPFVFDPRVCDDVCTKCGTAWRQDGPDTTNERKAYERTSRIKKRTFKSHTGKAVVKEAGASLYDPESNLRDHLLCIQGRDKPVPREVMEIIWASIHKERLDVTKLNQKTIRRLLNRNTLSSHYRSKVQILARITCKVPKQFTAEQEKQIVKDFRKIVKIWPSLLSKRTSLLRYSIILYKICEMHGWTDWLSEFSLLKSRAKLYKQINNGEWKEICEKLNWPFIKTIAMVKQ